MTGARWSGIPMPPDWPKIRKAILERDRGTCQIRGDGCTFAATEVDHITPVSRGGTNLASNLQSVCKHCHQQKTNADRPRERRPDEPHPGLR